MHPSCCTADPFGISASLITSAVPGFPEPELFLIFVLLSYVIPYNVQGMWQEYYEDS